METQNWISEMIERESIPKAARENTVAEFCAKWGISEATYYNHSSRDENQKQIVKLSLMLVKKSLPEVLEKLREKAEAGDTKAIDMFLNYVVELSKNLDLKSGGQSLIPITIDKDIAEKNAINAQSEDHR